MGKCDIGVRDQANIADSPLTRENQFSLISAHFLSIIFLCNILVLFLFFIGNLSKSS